jgi:transposase
MQLMSTITCSRCGSKTTEQMELNACWYLYTCRACGE